MANQMIIVGMADLKVAKSPLVLTTLGLGSCVGVCLYDSVAKVAGLAHIMLPSSKQVRNSSVVAKFADTGIVKLIQDMQRLGGRKERLKAKLAGGAQMFAFQSTNEALRIGDRNIEACDLILRQLSIPIIARDVGSNYGRTIEFYCDDGRLFVKTIGHGNKLI